MKKVAGFKGTLGFTDVGGRQIHRPRESKLLPEVEAKERRKMGVEKAAGHLQSFRYTFTTDAAAGKIKLMTGLSGTTDFLDHLGILYDTFGITCKASTSQPITPEQVIQNLNRIDEYIKAAVMNVKETNNLKEDSTTNGPQKTECPRRHKPLSSFY